MSKVRLAGFNPEKGTIDEVFCDNENLDTYYQYLECGTFDIAYRDVNGTTFDIFCDDEGLFKEELNVSALSSDKESVLVGNLIFAHHNAQGETTAVTDDDMKLLRKCVKKVVHPVTDEALSYLIYPVNYPV